MRDLIGAGLTAVMLAVVCVPLLLGRKMLRQHHREQFAATGATFFDAPSLRAIELELPVEHADAAPAPVEHHLTEADLSARTPSTTLTVDREHLAEVLQLEITAEYAYNRPTWVEADAAAQFLRDPLGSALLPPLPLVAEAGNPALADTFWRLLREGGLTTDWSDEDSDFDAWYAPCAA